MTRSICIVVDCKRSIEIKLHGWCRLHYARWIRHGDITRHPTRVRIGTRYITQHGYVMVLAPGHPEAAAHGWVYEHRKKWHDLRGPIPPRMLVHHRNDDKTDNRIRNLQLLTRAEHTVLHAAERRMAA